MESWRFFKINLGISSGKLTLYTCDGDNSAEDEIPCDYSSEENSLTFYVKPFLEILETIDSDSIKILFDTSKITVAVQPVPQEDNCYFIKQAIRRG